MAGGSNWCTFSDTGYRHTDLLSINMIANTYENFETTQQMDKAQYENTH